MFYVIGVTIFVTACFGMKLGFYLLGVDFGQLDFINGFMGIVLVGFCMDIGGYAFMRMLNELRS